MNRRYLVFLFLFSSFLFAKPIEYSQIDSTKVAIQVAVVKNLKSLNPLASFDKKYDTYIEKRKLYVYYIVNIDKNDKKRVIQDIRKRMKGAFFTSTKYIGKKKGTATKNTKATTIKQASKVEEEQDVLQSDVVEPRSSSSLNSSDITRTPQYQKALNVYKRKNYQLSYELFNELFFKDMGNILVNYYLGRSAYEIKEYEFAISAYDRILIAEPFNIRVRLELAQTYLQMQLYTQALKEFNTVLGSEKLPLKVQEKVIANVERIKQKQTKHFFNVTALLGIIYDSNINNSPEAGTFDIYNPTLDSDVSLTNSGEEHNTMIYQTVGIFSHKYVVEDNFNIENTLTLMNLKYDDYKEKDVHYISAAIQPTFYEKTSKTAVSFSFDKVLLGHKSYQYSYYVNPTYTTILDKEFLYTIGLKLGRVNYNSEPTKNADVIEWQNSLKYAANEKSVFNFSTNLGKEYERYDVRTDVSNKYITLGVTNNYSFHELYTLQSGLNYNITYYRDEDVNFLSRKKDKKSDFLLNLQRKIDGSSIVSAGGTYTKKDSNHESSPYSKYTIKLNYIKNF